MNAHQHRYRTAVAVLLFMLTALFGIGVGLTNATQSGVQTTTRARITATETEMPGSSLRTTTIMTTPTTTATPTPTTTVTITTMVTPSPTATPPTITPPMITPPTITPTITVTPTTIITSTPPTITPPTVTPPPITPPIPIPPPPPTTPVTGTHNTVIAAGIWHTCALTEAGGVLCWGLNEYGELGDGTSGDGNLNTRDAFSTTPVQVIGLESGVTAIAAGDIHTCALTEAGNVLCWGWNEHGQLGDGTGGEFGDISTTPVQVSGLESGVSAIAAGGAHTCALTEVGSVLCWGSNSHGQLGDGTSGDGDIGTLDAFSPIPVPVNGLESDVSAIAAGSVHTCIITNEGGVVCWGYNGLGQLGDGTGGEFGDISTTPVQVSGLESGVSAIAAGDIHTCALTEAGDALCWGWNEYGQLGDGTEEDSSTPVQLSGLESRVTAIAAGWDHTCALTDAGVVFCWGSNLWGQLGNGTFENSTTPVQVSGLVSGVTAITAGDRYTCALLDDGSMRCWGRNEFGQLGDGTTADSAVPVQVALTEPIRQPAPGTLPPSTPTTGGISGKVMYADGSDAPRVRVTLYRQEGGVWQPVVAAGTDRAGEYAFTRVVSGTYRAWFFDTTRTHRSVYYPNTTTFAEADDIIVVDDQVTTGIDATLEPPAPPVAESETASGSVTIDIDNGTLDIAFVRGNTSALTITTEVTCTSGLEPTDVTLWLGTTAYSMTEEPAGSGQYQATIPADDIDWGGLKVTWQCDGDAQEKTIGGVVLYDPSGIISDSTTGEPIQGAQVILYNVPGALPDTATETRDCRTVDTRGGDTWDNLPRATGDEGVVVNPDIDLSATVAISPTINPQTTNVDGRYGWDVSEGCWYIEVSADGYRSTFSPIVGVPPEVTDLDIALDPARRWTRSRARVYLPLIGSPVQ